MVSHGQKKDVVCHQNAGLSARERDVYKFGRDLRAPYRSRNAIYIM